jgi:hypothetical protein
MNLNIACGLQIILPNNTLVTGEYVVKLLLINAAVTLMNVAIVQRLKNARKIYSFRIYGEVKFVPVLSFN